MKNLVLGQKQRVADWVASRIVGASPWTGSFEAIGLEKNGELVAGVLVDGYVKDTRCSLHCAGDGKYWLTRGFLAAVFAYAFEQLNCKVIVNLVSSSNIASLKFTAHIGFVEKCRIRNGYPDGDMVVFELQRDNCRWIRRKKC